MLISIGVMQLTAFPLAGYLAASQDRFYLSPTSFPQFAAMVFTMVRGLPFLSGALVQLMAHVMTLVFVPIYLALIWKTRTREQVIDAAEQALGVVVARQKAQLCDELLPFEQSHAAASRRGVKREDFRGRNRFTGHLR